MLFAKSGREAVFKCKCVRMFRSQHFDAQLDNITQLVLGLGVVAPPGPERQRGCCEALES